MLNDFQQISKNSPKKSNRPKKDKFKLKDNKKLTESLVYLTQKQLKKLKC
jgi:hypothetical protein